MPKVTYRLELRNKVEEEQFIRKLLKLRDRAIRDGDSRAECRYLCDLQGLYFGCDNYEETINISEQIILKSKKDLEIHVSYDRLLKSLLELKDYSKAANIAERYIESAESSNIQRSIFDAYNLHGLVFLRKSESDEATVSDAEKATKSFIHASRLLNAQRISQPKDSASLFINMAILCKNRGNYSKSINYLEKAMSLSEHKDLENYTLALLNLIYTLVDAKDFQKAYANLKLYKTIAQEQKVDRIIDYFDLECMAYLIDLILCKLFKFSEAKELLEAEIEKNLSIQDSETDQNNEDMILGLESKISAWCEIQNLDLKLAATPPSQSRILLLEKRYKLYRVCEAFERAADDLLDAYNTEKDLHLPLKLDLVLNIVECYLDAENVQKSLSTLMPILKRSKSTKMLGIGIRMLELLLDSNFRQSNIENFPSAKELIELLIEIATDKEEKISLLKDFLKLANFYESLGDAKTIAASIRKLQLHDTDKISESEESDSTIDCNNSTIMEMGRVQKLSRIMEPESLDLPVSARKKTKPITIDDDVLHPTVQTPPEISNSKLKSSSVTYIEPGAFSSIGKLSPESPTTAPSLTITARISPPPALMVNTPVKITNDVIGNSNTKKALVQKVVIKYANPKGETSRFSIPYTVDRNKNGKWLRTEIKQRYFERHGVKISSFSLKQIDGDILGPNDLLILSLEDSDTLDLQLA